MEITERALTRCVESRCSCGGKGPLDRGVCVACQMYHAVKAASRPSTLEAERDSLQRRLDIELDQMCGLSNRLSKMESERDKLWELLREASPYVCSGRVGDKIRSALRIPMSKQGLWRCSCCGEAYDEETKMDGSWRGMFDANLNPVALEHKCPGGFPQAGHMPCEWFGEETK